jgi:hypothetical protein
MSFHHSRYLLKATSNGPYCFDSNCVYCNDLRDALEQIRTGQPIVSSKTVSSAGQSWPEKETLDSVLGREKLKARQDSRMR